MVAAAGNDGLGEDTVNQPAFLDSVITVATTDVTDSRAFFSSTEPTVELTAPGVAALVIASGITGLAAVRQRMQQTAQDLGPPGRDEHFGYGLVRADWAAGGYNIIVTGSAVGGAQWPTGLIAEP